MVRIRGSQLVRNECNASNSHSPIAIMENRGRPDEIYRHVDCFYLRMKVVFVLVVRIY